MRRLVVSDNTEVGHDQAPGALFITDALVYT